MAEATWSTVIYERLRAAGIRLVAHVPDNIVAPIIRCFEADTAVTTVSCTREEEGVGIIAGGLLERFANS